MLNNEFFNYICFIYSYFYNDTKDVVFWGIILLLNFISKCSDNIIEGKS